MGQQQLRLLKEEIKLGPNIDKLTSQTSFDFLKNIIEQTEITAKETLTPECIQHHIMAYLQNMGNVTRRRSRSYQLLKVEEQIIEKRCENIREGQCKVIQEQMQWVEIMGQYIRQNITEIMATQQIFKIRQNFRNLILKILKLDNLYLQIIYQNDRIEYHDFKSNYITDVLEENRKEILEGLINSPSLSINDEILDAFELSQQAKYDHQLYSWDKIVSNKKFKVGVVWKSPSLQLKVGEISNKLLQKVVNICIIQTLQQESTAIQNYSKNLLDIYEIFITQSEVKTCKKISNQLNNFHDVEDWLMGEQSEESNSGMLARVRAFQRLQYELLEKIRLYKKYVCQSDKIFFDFDEQASLAFLTNNFKHKSCNQLGRLHERQKLYIENIFKQNKSINDFLKKAIQKKVKHNKLYELDFETKASVKYDEEGRITRLHVIIQQLQSSSSHSSSNIYSISSTKILSQSSQKKSDGEKQQQPPVRHSVLVKNLQRQNPGIINEGWINLFIKDHHIVRKNTHLKHKDGKTYTVKRSFSLNRENMSDDNNTNEDSEIKQKVSKINIQSIDLNLLSIDEQLLQPLATRIFKKLQYYHEDNINKSHLQNFITELQNGYQTHNNPFHNFTHGLNVMHTSYLLSTTPKSKQALTPFKIFTIVFSALCHDVGHTGFTNLFQIASHSKKAVTYNDNSPLQNFHAAYTFQLLRKPENNFLKSLTLQEKKDFRKSVISNILYTDIKEHFPLLKKFNAVLKDEIPKNEEYVSLLSGMIIHTSDFGGSAKQFEICKQWSLKVNLQFSNQYKKEGELGLPQTPFMKDLTNIQTLSKNEGGFLKVIVLPLYEAMDEFNGTEFNIRRLRQYVESNIKQWQRINKQSQQQKIENE